MNFPHPPIPRGKTLVLLAEDLRLEDNLAVAIAADPAREGFAVLRIHPEARGGRFARSIGVRSKTQAKRASANSFGEMGFRSKFWSRATTRLSLQHAADWDARLSSEMPLMAWRQRTPIGSDGSGS